MKRRIAHYIVVLGALYVVSGSLLYVGADAWTGPMRTVAVGLGTVILGFLLPLSSAIVWVTAAYLALALRLAHQAREAA